MKETYISLYFKWKESNEIPEAGLCFSLNRNDELLNLFKPTEEDIHDGDYWGYDGAPRNMFNNYLDVDVDKVHHEFTPLRQNIILFMAAINGEL